MAYRLNVGHRTGSGWGQLDCDGAGGQLIGHAAFPKHGTLTKSLKLIASAACLQPVQRLEEQLGSGKRALLMRYASLV